MSDRLTLLLRTLEDLTLKELKKFCLYLSDGTLEDFTRIPKGRLQEHSDVTHVTSEMTRAYGVEKSLKITLQILREIQHNELAARLEAELERTQTNAQDLLSSELDVSASERQQTYDELQNLKTAIQADLKRKYGNIVEGDPSKSRSVSLNEIFVDVYITEGGTGDINDQHEVRQIEVTQESQRNRDTPIKCTDIFKCLSEQKRQITSVLTKGIAGIGKTVLVQKFILDWAEEKANSDIAVVVSLPFRDLNLKTKIYSLTDLLSIYAPQLKKVDNLENIAHRMLLIMDGLDECRHHLDFQNSPWWSDISEPTTVDVLLTNLIMGNLLSSALKWITSRPAAASQIPAGYFDRVTEVRGFGDSQKEEYFRKRIVDEKKADMIVAHIKTSRTIYIMCHIPIFCWISATVFQDTFDDAKSSELPQTLTEMYTHFLFIQICIKNRKYYGADAGLTNKISNSDKEMILKLGKLAFNELGKGNVIFYAEDLKKCGIDINKASEYSSLCTEIFREEKGLYSEKVFCFVHMSIQEFLAAVYVHVSCVEKNMDVLTLHGPKKHEDQVMLSDIHRKAAETALQSPKGHLDLFLRFLLGLSCTDRKVFSPSSHMNDFTSCAKKTVQFIKDQIRTVKAPERTINLLHCLSEMKDNSLVAGIQTDIKSGTVSCMEPDKCSALTYAVLMSGDVLETFNLKTLKASADGQERLLGVLKACKNARLDGCCLTPESCEIVASALHFVNSPLRELDLSYNNIGDKGVKFLCTGLTSSNCSLTKLSLSGCSLTAESCGHLASALVSRSSALTELDLSYNNVGDEGVLMLCPLLMSQHCSLTTLSLAKCNLTKDACEHVALAIKTLGSSITKLHLSHNNVTDLGMEPICDALMSAHCKLSSLRVAACNLTSESCKSLAKVIQCEGSSLSDLNLNYNFLEDLGVILLCEGLMNSHCELRTLMLRECSLSDGCCLHLANVLQSPTSKLIKLQLQENDLKDSGVESLSVGLQDQGCSLQTLGLTGCRITQQGCFSLARALDQNPLHLKNLFLDFNNPGEEGKQCLSEWTGHADYKLERLTMSSIGDVRMNAGPRKYFCSLTLDNTFVYKMLSVSNGNKDVTFTLPYPSEYEIILSTQALTKQCYWEVEVSGDRIEIGVSSRAGCFRSADDQMGQKGLFPCLVIYLNKLYGFLHQGEIIESFSDFDCPHRIGLYLNKHAECLSFYSVCEDKLTLLGKFYSTEFCEMTNMGKLFAAFRIYANSTVKLCAV